MSWLGLAALGAYQGLNPGMGWLFAVALGLQEHRRRAVVGALLPIAVGHEASVAVVAAVVTGARLVSDPGPVRVAGAVALVAFGVFKLARPLAHPRWRAMPVSPWDLVVWSFLMATAHRAGLMLVPAFLGLAHDGGGHIPESVATVRADLGGLSLTALLAVAVHTLTMLAVMGAVAMVVYQRVGVAILRKAWLNFDLVWALAVLSAGVVTLFT